MAREFAQTRQTTLHRSPRPSTLRTDYVTSPAEDVRHSILAGLGEPTGRGWRAAPREGDLHGRVTVSSSSWDLSSEPKTLQVMKQLDD